MGGRLSFDQTKFSLKNLFPSGKQILPVQTRGHMPAEAMLVRSLLKDVALEGAVVIEKRKLLWLLGWGQDRTGAWDELLTHWREIGQERETLYGYEAHGKIVLSLRTPKAVLVPVAEWA